MTGRLPAALAAGALALALAACSPGYSDEPGVDDLPPVDIAQDAAPDECAEAFPSATVAPSLGDAPTVPGDWPAAPEGSTLCVVMQTSDTNAVLQYVTSLTPDQVLDGWEPLLAGYELARSDGIGDNPILNATSPTLEFAIQTDAGTKTYFVAFGTL
jgi:hypothetical protein